MLMSRGSNVLSLTIANGAAVSDAFDMSNAAAGIVLMPAAWTAASIGFQVSDTSTGTFYPLYDDDGALVQIDSPAVDLAYSFNAETFGAMWVKLWSQDGAAASANQGAARTLKVLLKS